MKIALELGLARRIADELRQDIKRLQAVVDAIDKGEMIDDGAATTPRLHAPCVAICPQQAIPHELEAALNLLPLPRDRGDTILAIIEYLHLQGNDWVNYSQVHPLLSARAGAASSNQTQVELKRLFKSGKLETSKESSTGRGASRRFYRISNHGLSSVTQAAAANDTSSATPASQA